MNKALTGKSIMFLAMIFFMAFYMVVFGTKNAAIGMMIMMAAFMNLENDLSYRPLMSLTKILILLLILGIVSFLNNPISILGCIFTFLVVFATTFSSYHLFGNDVYMPFLMCYLMMMCIPVTLSDLPMRLLSLVFGAVFIVGLNILVNRQKTYKLSKQTLDNLVNEVINACDLKLNNEDVSIASFKTANGFYSSLFSKFQYKYFPSDTQESVLDVIKSFQYIGKVIADYNLTKSELNHIKGLMKDIQKIDLDDIYDVHVETKEMYLVLLNFEIIVHEVGKNNFDNDRSIPDKDSLRQLIIPVIQRQFSFRSVKFTFAFKMAFVITLWEILTLFFNLPYTKWLYFATVPLMLPYVNDIAETAKNRFKGTVVGVLIFTIILIFADFIPIPSDILVLFTMLICMFGMILKLENKFLLSVFTSIMSVITSLMYISPAIAIPLKIIWVAVAMVAAIIINIGFLPYSVEKETANNLYIRKKLNIDSIDLIKERCSGIKSFKKTTVLVLSNIVGDNIEITENNNEIFEIQSKITDICNFIMNYMDVHEFSKDFKEKLVRVMDNGESFGEDYKTDELIILYSVEYVCKLMRHEEKLF